MSDSEFDPQQTQFEIAAAVLMSGQPVELDADDPREASVDFIAYMRDTFGAKCSRESNEITVEFIGGATARATFRRK